LQVFGRRSAGKHQPTKRRACFEPDGRENNAKKRCGSAIAGSELTNEVDSVSLVQLGHALATCAGSKSPIDDALNAIMGDSAASRGSEAPPAPGDTQRVTWETADDIQTVNAALSSLASVTHGQTAAQVALDAIVRVGKLTLELPRGMHGTSSQEQQKGGCSFGAVSAPSNVDIWVGCLAINLGSRDFYVVEMMNEAVATESTVIWCRQLELMDATEMRGKHKSLRCVFAYSRSAPGLHRFVAKSPLIGLSDLPSSFVQIHPAEVDLSMLKAVDLPTDVDIQYACALVLQMVSSRQVHLELMDFTARAMLLWLNCTDPSAVPKKFREKLLSTVHLWSDKYGPELTTLVQETEKRFAMPPPKSRPESKH